MGHICDTWPITQLTRDPHDPVPDHGMSRSWLLTNHAELTTIAFYSLQSGIMDVAYALYSKSSSLYGNCYKLNTVNSSLIMCDFFVNVNSTSNEHPGPTLHTKRKLCLNSYTCTPHLIMGQVFYGTDPWPIHICWPIWPMTCWSIVCSELNSLGNSK